MKEKDNSKNEVCKIWCPPAPHTDKSAVNSYCHTVHPKMPGTVYSGIFSEEHNIRIFVEPYSSAVYVKTCMKILQNSKIKK